MKIDKNDCKWGKKTTINLILNYDLKVYNLKYYWEERVKCINSFKSVCH